MYKILKKYDCGVIRFKIPNFNDERGNFSKIYNYEALLKIGLDFEPKEHFYSISNKNVLRGLHFQTNKSAHNKIISCIQGSMLDICVDVREDSKFFNQPIEIYMNENSNEGIFIPKGFAHGFLSLEDSTIVQYLTDKIHDPNNDKGVLWNSINYSWPIKKPTLSLRDSSHPNIGVNKWKFF